MKINRTIEELIEAKKALGWPDDRIVEYLADLTGGRLTANTLVIPDRTPTAALSLAA